VNAEGGPRAGERSLGRGSDPAYELGSPLSAEDTELLQALMNAGSADRVEFMG
jgi:hypothetical protein